jgi:DnaK suppressor protein
MRKTDLVRFRRIFTEQKNQILMNSGMLDEGFVNSPEDKDEVDQANANIEQAMRMQLRNRETFTLSRINDAIRRIDEGAFGRCDTCDEYIELRRLQARPTTTLCISCKEEEEKMNASAILGHRLQAVH